MEANGWRFDLTHDGSNWNDHTYKQVGLKCGPEANWYGWSEHSSVGTLSAILKGSGEVTIDFGNCWQEGNVKLYLDSALIFTAPSETKSIIKSFSFTHGSMLKIKDEDGNAVISLNSITFNCKGMSAGRYLLRRNTA